MISKSVGYFPLLRYESFSILVLGVEYTFFFFLSSEILFSNSHYKLMFGCDYNKSEHQSQNFKPVVYTRT